MENKLVLKIRISRDFSFAEFDAPFDIETGEGLPTSEQLKEIFELLPGKENQPTKESAAKSDCHDHSRNGARREPPATANQRRTLERYGEWREGMTKSEASAALTRLGF